MERQILEFLNDKIQFLEKFSRGEFLIHPVLIGFIFSFVQKDLKDKVDLFKALKRIRNQVDDSYQVAYAVVKSLKSAEVYLEQFESQEFLDEYCEITSGLASMKIPKALEGKVTVLFCANWNKLAQIYAKSEKFFKVYYLGKKNIRLFARLPSILTSELEEDVTGIIRFLEDGDESEIALNISKVLRFLRFQQINHLDQKVLGDFLATSIKTLFRTCVKLETIQEINKKVEENNECFDELSRIELKNDFNSRMKSKNAYVQKPCQKAKAELNQYEKKDVVEFYPSKQNIIKIPEKKYFEEKPAHVGYSSNPKPLANQFIQQRPKASSHFFEKSDEAPSVIILSDRDIYQTLKDILQSCLTQSKTQEIDKNAIISMFESYEHEEVTFSNQLRKVLNETINESYSDENYEFWEMIIEVSKSFLKNDEFSEIIEKLNAKNTERSQNEQVRRGSSRLIHSPRQDPPSYGLKNSKKQDSFNSKKPEEVQKIPENPVNPVEVAKVEEKLQNIHPEEAKKSIIDLSCGYFKVLNNQCKDFIDGIRSQTTELAQINEPIQRIKDLLKEKSPGSKLNLIGSAYSGTHIKGTEVDLNFIDFLNPEPASLLRSVIEQVALTVISEYSNHIIFAFGDIRYSVHINLDFYYESSLLVKTYCGLDSRCKELVILMKLWAHKHGVYQGLLTGFHITLLCITFLQMCQPAILPLLQQGDHKAELFNEVDTWYERNSEFFSTNTSTLGEIIIYFFHFMLSLAEGYTCFPSSGQVLPYDSDVFLSCCSLFGNKEVSAIFKSSESSSILKKSLSETVENLASQSDLYKIMRI